MSNGLSATNVFYMKLPTSNNPFTLYGERVMKLLRNKISIESSRNAECGRKSVITYTICV